MAVLIENHGNRCPSPLSQSLPDEGLHLTLRRRGGMICSKWHFRPSPFGWMNGSRGQVTTRSHRGFRIRCPAHGKAHQAMRCSEYCVAECGFYRDIVTITHSFCVLGPSKAAAGFMSPDATRLEDTTTHIVLWRYVHNDSSFLFILL